MITARVHRCIAKIVRKYEAMGTQPSVGHNLAVALFRSLERRDDEFIPRWTVRAFDAEYDFFMSRAHLAHAIEKAPTSDDLVKNFEAFERAFHSLVGPYFSGKEELDAILQRTNETAGAPTKQQVDTAVQRMRSPEFAAYFFSRLQNPKWITSLEDSGILGAPPVATRADNGGAYCPHWPVSAYLARMAVESPTVVARALAAIETDNVSVIGDVVKAASVMPPKVATSLVSLVCRAAETGSHWIGFTDVSDLCIRLSKGGEADAALTLAEALFTPEFAEGEEKPRWQDDYWYKEGLGKVVPVLAESKGAEFIPKLCDWLDAAVRAREHVDSDSGKDLSYFWRPAIEDHEQNRDYQFAGVMVGFVRDGFEYAIRARQLSLTGAIELLDRYTFLVFKRIRVYLIDEFADESPELAKQTILNRKLFGHYGYKHEYAKLVEHRFGLLSQEQQLEWFGWVDAGDHVEHALGEELTDEDRRGIAQERRFKKLHWVREHLDGPRREFYEKMLAERGKPEMADLNVRIEVGWGDGGAPMTVEELTAMTFEQAVVTVSGWELGGSRFDGPSVEGLASVFKHYVATSPVEFSAHARTLFDSPPIYVRMFIAQMGRRPIRANRSILKPLSTSVSGSSTAPPRKRPLRSR